MEKRIRDEKTGRYIQKGKECRKIRSIRLTDRTWKRLEELAKEQGISKADFLEKLITEDIFTNDENKKYNIPQGSKENHDSVTKEKMTKALNQLADKLKVGKQADFYRHCKKFIKFMTENK